MWISGKREKQVVSLFLKHCEKVEETLHQLRTFIEGYMEDPDSVSSVYQKVCELESEADKLRRETERGINEGAFLPNFRGDLTELMELVDKIANKAEYVADLFSLQKPKIPEELKGYLLKQLEISLKAFRSLRKAVESLFEDLAKVESYVLEVERFEHEEDMVEKEALKKLFDMEIEKCEKIELKEIMRSIGDIADRAEDASDRILVIVAKRRF